MTETAAGIAEQTRTIVVEKELPYPAERVWRALTRPELIAEWLMPNDFRAEVGHRFDLRGDWGSVACEVLAIEPERRLTYSWAANGLESVVTWTLAPSGGGTSLRMEQTGFRRDQPQFYEGAKAGWPRFVAALEAVLARAG